MYTQMLVPLDGSNTAEKVLPYARYFAGKLKIPVQLLAVVDVAEMATHLSVDKARFLDTIIEESIRSSEIYLRDVAKTFLGAEVKCTVEKGRAKEVIIEKGKTDMGMLITMSTHGRSGLNRFLLGSIAEKVLRGSANPLLLVRATKEEKSEGEAALKSIIAPLDGSKLAESVLPMVAGLAKKLDLEVILFRAYYVPYRPYANNESYFASVDHSELIASLRGAAAEYLETKTAEVKKLGVDKVTYAVKEGIASDEIIALVRQTPNNLIAMCSHGRTGMERWVVGSITETVVRHSNGPVLVVRAK
jgi:nucleotide-binding universal stress UspA family protein